jgi:hypothetical protein
MSNVELQPFKAQHAYQMVEGKITPEFVKAMLKYEEMGNSMTVTIDHKFLCCGGVIVEAGTGSLWMVTSPLVNRYPVAFHRAIRKWLALFIDLYNLNRLQAYVDAQNSTYVKWIEALGFNMEGLMKKFYNGKDYFMYARLRGGGQ